MSSFMAAFLLMTLMGMMTAGGQVLIKLGMKGRERPAGITGMILFCVNLRIIVGLLLVLIAPLVYIQALKHLGLSGAYGLNGLSYIFVFAFSRIFLGEKATILHLAGLILIVGGVAVWSI